jgi:hypothetical protein
MIVCSIIIASILPIILLTGDIVLWITLFFSAQLALPHDVNVSVEHSVDNTSDHDPATIGLQLKVGQLFTTRAEVARKPAWHKCTDIHITQYKNKLSSALTHIKIPAPI